MLQVIIPARLESSRLPEKMLQKIGDKTVIRHSVERILEGCNGIPATVATDSELISREIGDLCPVVVTSSSCRTGSDRVAEAIEIIDPDGSDVVVNIQADMPLLRPSHLASFLRAAGTGGKWDVLTAFVDSRLVRVRLDSFERVVVPTHVGFYAFTRTALRKFAAAPSAPAEVAYGLEQLRAVEIGLKFDFHVIPEMPLEVNTPQDLAAMQWGAACLTD